jgi:branched-subunit amino acid transport protein AzlD
MPDLRYMIAAVAIGGVITLLLRALPFAILRPLRKSRFVRAVGRWMPAGLLLILAVVMLAGEVAARPGRLWIVAVGVATTVIVHLFAGRRALLSIFAGTGVYVLLLALF